MLQNDNLRFFKIDQVSTDVGEDLIVEGQLGQLLTNSEDQIGQVRKEDLLLLVRLSRELVQESHGLDERIVEEVALNKIVKRDTLLRVSVDQLGEDGEQILRNILQYLARTVLLQKIVKLLVVVLVVACRVVTVDERRVVVKKLKAMLMKFGILGSYCLMKYSSNSAGWMWPNPPSFQSEFSLMKIEQGWMAKWINLACS
ncbi:hypothetical protein WICPIJ_007195 [Wickerhamomyces pijperi]|uniref:Uncharacterized protein n=1 Tax=Wickerhamomyces pijperi TaxID=599730 RepID=A0A9P8TK61_WICPI|nr:hypothetical protein WICPIJ_007195 [Wickerhamomyces pijperi]